jgi:hypothetical protein
MDLLKRYFLKSADNFHSKSLLFQKDRGEKKERKKDQ